jgi:hypothetical protein
MIVIMSEGELAQNRITLRFKIGAAEFAEAEAGMASALGANPPRQSMLGRLAASLVGLVPSTVTIDDAVVHQGSVTRAWRDFGLTYETENLVVLVITKSTGPLSLPKSAMSAGDLEAIRRLVAEKVVSTPTDLAWIQQVRTGRTK